MAKEQEIEVTVGSDNIFADLGFEYPEEELTRAKLVSLIWREIQQRGLTQKAAGAIMGIDQPKVSALMAGRIGGFSVERLMGMLNSFGQDVEITIRPSRHARGRITVTGVAGVSIEPKGRGARYNAPGVKIAATVKRAAASSERGGRLSVAAERTGKRV